MAIEDFELPYSQNTIDDLQHRLRNVRWPVPGGVPGWTCGTDVDFLREFCHLWASDFDWQRKINSLQKRMRHYRFVDGDDSVHFIHERGRGPNSIPIVLTHGWPGSFLEMEAILPMLTDPAAFGGQAADSFDVVIPSLPGFGYSNVSRKPGTNVQRVADLWARLMAELGYDRFVAQGGDIGAGVTTALALRYPDRLLGIHLNYLPGSYRPFVQSDSELSTAESEFLSKTSEWADIEGAYAHMQRTKPLTASYGLSDSPVGLAGWILEKFHSWSDCRGDVFNRFTQDFLLANLTLYWTTNTIGQSFRMYYEGAKAPLQLGRGQRVRVPTAFGEFPFEISHPPRSWVERGYDVVRWTTMPKGGHFAAAEEPQLLAQDLRDFCRRFRH